MLFKCSNEKKRLIRVHRVPSVQTWSPCAPDAPCGALQLDSLFRSLRFTQAKSDERCPMGSVEYSFVVTDPPGTSLSCCQLLGRAQIRGPVHCSCGRAVVFELMEQTFTHNAWLSYEHTRHTALAQEFVCSSCLYRTLDRCFFIRTGSSVLDRRAVLSNTHCLDHERGAVGVYSMALHHV